MKCVLDFSSSVQIYHLGPGKCSGRLQLTTSVFIDEKIGLDFPFAEQVTVTNPSCFTWTNTLDQVERSIEKLEELTWFVKVDPDGL